MNPQETKIADGLLKLVEKNLEQGNYVGDSVRAYEAFLQTVMLRVCIQKQQSLWKRIFG